MSDNAAADATADHETGMPVKKSLRRWAGAVAVLLAFGAASGLWWNAKRLNVTERQLADVWVSRFDEGSADWDVAHLLLADRRMIDVIRNENRGHLLVETSSRWGATAESFSYRLDDFRPPTGNSFTERLRYVGFVLRGKRVSQAISRLTADRMVLESSGYEEEWFRSEDAELLRIFARLTAGETPEKIEADGLRGAQ